MKVKELIEKLQKEDPEAIVVYPDFEDMSHHEVRYISTVPSIIAEPLPNNCVILDYMEPK